MLQLEPAVSESQRLARVAKLCGDTFAEQSVLIEREVKDMALSGWVGLPTFNRSQPDLQYWFVNGRSVTDKTLAHAARHAYRDVLFHGRYPAYVLNLSINPATVDANAHPAKLEVRFRDSRRVHGFVSQSLETVLKDTRPGGHAQSPTLHSVSQPAGATSYLQSRLSLPSGSDRGAVKDTLALYQSAAAAAVLIAAGR